MLAGLARTPSAPGPCEAALSAVIAKTSSAVSPASHPEPVWLGRLIRGRSAGNGFTCSDKYCRFVAAPVYPSQEQGAVLFPTDVFHIIGFLVGADTFRRMKHGR